MSQPTTCGGIRLVSLGGTISMTDGPNGATPTRHAYEIAEGHQQITKSVDIALVGGSEIDFDILRKLTTEIDTAISEGSDGVVITTGTDSIEETAGWIACSGPWPIPIAITGSMLPGARFGSDADANLFDAVAVAGDKRATQPVVVFGGRIFAAHEVLKVSGLERMAFDSPGYGAVGTVLPNGPDWHRPLTPWRFTLGRPGLEFPTVPILSCALGDDGSMIGFASRISDILVISANGAGNMPPAQSRAAIRAADKGKLVIVTSRAPDSRSAPVYGYPGGSATLRDHDIVIASGLSAHRARVILAIGYSKTMSLDGLRKFMELGNSSHLQNFNSS